MSFIYKYPHPAVTTDCVILTFHEDELKILLVKRGIEPFKGYWALPGGFLKMDESAEEGALRELREETGVDCRHIKQFHTFTAPYRDPRERVITIAFYALMKWQKATGADDAEFADWISVLRLPPLAFDHKLIIEMALEAIKRDIYFEPVGFDLLNDIFSMTELQKVYEAILGKEFDRRNFAKKMKHLQILEEVDDVVQEERKIKRGPEKKSVPLNKRSPLPFLNDDFYDASVSSFGNGLAMTDSLPYDMKFDETHRLEEKSSLFSEPTRNNEKQEKHKNKRRSLFFRLNKKRYDIMKKDDGLEF